VQDRLNHLDGTCFVGHNCGGELAEMRQSGMWNGRIKEHVEADVMDMECGVLSVARRQVTD
jgi:hypothetical protein